MAMESGPGRHLVHQALDLGAALQVADVQVGEHCTMRRPFQVRMQARVGQGQVLRQRPGPWPPASPKSPAVAQAQQPSPPRGRTRSRPGPGTGPPA